MVEEDVEGDIVFIFEEFTVGLLNLGDELFFGVEDLKFRAEEEEAEIVDKVVIVV